MIARYIASLTRRRLAPTTIRVRLFYLRKFAEQHDLMSGTLAQMEAFIDANKHWSDNTRQTVVASLRSFYTWAAREGLTATNPAADLLRVRVKRRRSRMATETQIRNALANSDTADQAMVLLGAECGLRVSEIAALKLSDREDDWLTIIGKGGHQRQVYLSPELAEILDRIEATTMRHGNYFPGRSGAPMHPSTIWRHIRDSVGINPHALRHRAGTMVYRNTGHDLRTTQEFLGHASPVTTQVYVHIERDDLIRASAASRVAA